MGDDKDDDAPSSPRLEEIIEGVREEHPSLEDKLIAYRRQRRSYDELRGRTERGEERGVAGVQPKYSV